MRVALLKVEEVSELLGCGVSTIWRWEAEGKFVPPIRINGITRWDAEEVQLFLASKRQVSGPRKSKTHVVKKSAKGRARKFRRKGEK